jgi:hypothetical protein
MKPILNNLEAKPPAAVRSISDRLPDAALTVKDSASMQKEVADLTKQLKQLFFESKTIHKTTTEAEKAKRKATFELEAIMNEKGLV